MKIKNMIIGAVASASMVASTLVPAFGASVVSNGSFELGTDPGVFTTVVPGGTQIDGWTVVSGNVDYIGTYWTASDGDRSIDMTGFEAGSIMQEVPTTVGAKYMVTFDMSGNPAGGPMVMSLDASAGTTTENFTYDTAVGNTLTDMMWEEQSFEFTATDAMTALTFSSLTAGFFGPALDNVSVEQVLPATADDCKKDGWMSYGVYKNQGDCVSYVATEGTNLPAVQ